MYKLDDTALAAYGAREITGPLTSECTSLQGVFSMPPREGESERNWGTAIEPFVEAPEMTFAGKTMTLHVMVGGATPAELESRLNTFKVACVECRKLSTPYGDFAVVVRDEIKIKAFSPIAVLVSIPFWQQEVVFGAVEGSPSGGAGYRLDGFDLRRDFGIVVSGVQNENSVGKRIEVSTTLPYTVTRYRDFADVVLECRMCDESLTGIYARMVRFQALCAAPGLRELALPDGSSFSGYVKEGFTANAACDRWITFDFKLRVI